MGNNIKTRYEGDMIADYVYDILSMNVCDSFFSGSFVREKECTNGYFDTYGYRALSTFERINANEYFDMLAKLLVLLGHVRECYINPDKLVINEETIYVGKDFSDIKLIPVFDFVAEDGEITEKFIQWAYDKIDEDDKEFVRATMKYVAVSSYNQREAKREVARIGREVKHA